VIENLLRERISLRGICRAVGVSLTWLLHFMVECFAACPAHLHARIPAKPTKVWIRGLEAEADELWSFVQKKANTGPEGGCQGVVTVFHAAFASCWISDAPWRLSAWRETDSSYGVRSCQPRERIRIQVNARARTAA
jgi:hypothetical protein